MVKLIQFGAGGTVALTRCGGIIGYGKNGCDLKLQQGIRPHYRSRKCDKYRDQSTLLRASGQELFSNTDLQARLDSFQDHQTA
jgi:hypothetical protein